MPTYGVIAMVVPGGLTIKKRLLLYGAGLLTLMAILATAVWLAFSSAKDLSILQFQFESATSHLQETMRRLNEYVISEGTPAPLKHTNQARAKFQLTCREILTTTQDPEWHSAVNQKILPKWQEIDRNIETFLAFEDVDLRNVEAMVQLGKVLAQSEALTEEMQGLNLALLNQKTSNQTKIIWQFWISMAMSFICMNLGMIFLYRSIIIPIRTLIETSGKIGRGDLEQRVEIQSNDEFGLLSESFNQMTENLSKTLVSQQQLDAIIESMLESVIVISHEKTIEKINQSTLKMLSYQKDDLIGKSFDVVTGLKSSIDVSSQLRPTQSFTERHYLAKSGEEIPVLFSKATIRSQVDDTNKTLCVALDLTQQNQTEKKLRDNEQRLQHIAYHDPLTNLPNRLLIQDRFQHAINKARRSEQKVAFLILDLDRFKDINDSLGHDIGDQLLKETADRLQSCVRDSDTVGRLGGDEFAIVLEQIEELTHVGMLVRRMLSKLAQEFAIEDHTLYISASIGISIYPTDSAKVDELVRFAEVAMYRAKEQGGNNYQLYTADMNARAHELLLLETHLRQALEERQLLLFYQPQYDLATGELAGMEALLRWRHPEKGMVSPGDFIPLAEETGLIVPIGEWVLRTACQQSLAWQKAGHPPVPVAVNISGRQFKEPDFIETVEKVLEETGLDPRWLELEITESVVMDRVEETILTLAELRGRGIQLAIDDFGTGYSSLSYLKRFPINKLKIDRSFVMDVVENPTDAAIAGSIVSLAHSMNLEVIAEGVETEAQMEFLKARGCHQIQGFLLGRPLPAEEFTGFFAKAC